MPMQEFLASYAVEVDESGAQRLQEVLQANRELAESLAGSFDAARSALSGLQSSLDGLDLQTAMADQLAFSDLPPLSVPVETDLSSAEEAAESYVARLEALRPMLRVNTSGVTTAVSSAVSSIRSMLSSLSITVPVRAVVSLDPAGIPTGGSGDPSGGTDPGSPGSAASSTPGGTPSIPAFGIGGRVREPTLAMIGEEGKPEYVIPTDREDRSVPLLQQLLSELPGSALKKLTMNMPGMEESSFSTPVSVFPEKGNSGAEMPEETNFFRRLNEPMPLPRMETGAELLPSEPLADFNAAISDLMAAARSQFLPAGTSPVVSSNSVEAPVTIQVTAPSAAPEEVGRSVYDLTQRYLLRTLKGVFT